MCEAKRNIHRRKEDLDDYKKGRMRDKDKARKTTDVKTARESE